MTVIHCSMLAVWPLAIALGAFAADAAAEIYRYVDERGGTHYSDNVDSVPPQYRDQLAEVSGELDDPGRFAIVRMPGAEEQEDEEPEESFSLPGLSPDGASGALGSIGAALWAWLIVIVLVMVPAMLALGGLILKLACRLAGADPPTLGRACLILVAQSVAGSIAGGLVNLVSIGGDEPGVGAAIALSGASALLSWIVGAAVLNAMTGYGMGRSLWVGVVHTVLVLVLILVPIAAIAAIAFLL